jgi:hypothetical protein
MIVLFASMAIREHRVGGMRVRGSRLEPVSTYASVGICAALTIAILVIASIAGFVPRASGADMKGDGAEPQLTKWNPPEKGAPDVTVSSAKDATNITWKSLKDEIEARLLPQINQLPAGSHVELRSFDGKPNWVIAVVSPAKETVANVWFGPDPKNGWKWDGLVRVGLVKSEKGFQIVTGIETFHRYSDGSYRRK